MIKLRLPWPPSINTYWRMFQNRMIISAAGREYAETVAYEIKQQRSHATLTGRLSVAITATMPDKRRRDIDNLIKVSLDSLTKAGVWEDDSQIDELAILRSGVTKPGWLDVTVCEIDGTRHYCDECQAELNALKANKT